MPRLIKAKEIPLRDAMEIIGKALFPEWTGAELNPAYFYLHYECSNRLHDPEIRTFLQSDFNDFEVLKRNEHDKKFNGNPRSFPKDKLTIPGSKTAIGWPKSLLSSEMAGTYLRFTNAWQVLLTLLRNGDISAYELKSGKDMKSIAKSKWHSRTFRYDLLRSEIYTQLNADPDNYAISGCFVCLADVEVSIKNLEDMEDIAVERGRPGMKGLIIQQLMVRAKNGLMDTSLNVEAVELRKWATKLVPTVETIENNIRKEHAKLAALKKTTK